MDALFRDVKWVKEWSKLPLKARRFVEYVEIS
jgi:adenylosuccinate synthase